MTIACLMLIVGSVCINASHDKKTADAMDELQARVGARPFFNRAERYSQFQLASNNWKVAFLEGNSDAVDMAVLSLCDHTIVSTGTFGWWAAWLAGGTTIIS
ncbi:hypothetical protein DPMN_109153 [Dreissena polymorpha]|uniref:L-Fucosyltransferase n=1 Tax=Dreissena polymorpha TaxID=45954 RepID=A0A9D4KA88_DREPO|nr:hypothetical protein DPMN_109153 [Dreissena polymorpha]